MPRQLQLTRRNDFFNDPFFADIMSSSDDGMKKKLDLFRQKSSALSVAGDKNEAAHNLQVTVSNDKFMIQLELPGFYPEDFSLKTKDNLIVLEAIHESKGEESTSRKYVKEFEMPEGVIREKLASSYSADGILTITAERKLNVPEGAKVEEAMAAASKAYTTDDGKTSVKQNSQQASQMIATSTQSPDGTLKSSSTYSSSSSSSSSVLSSSKGGPFPSVGGMPPMGGGNMSLDMDDMMKKMMGGMKMNSGSAGMSSNMSKMMSSSSSSFSSSSSTSSSSKVLRGPGSMGMSLPTMGEGIDIEEMSTAGTEFSGPPRYTVQSPRQSVDNTTVGEEIRHRVQAAPGYKPRTGSPEVDDTVLLKLREGNEYKLVLNMQKYSPENITVRLNDESNILTIIATSGPGSTDDFKQTHKVPGGIDLDQMTSSFSSDGMLVIKAPKKK